MPTEAKHPLFVTALARGLDVLRCFTPERPELGGTEIARLTGLPQSTVWRLCYTLQQQGCLVPGAAPERLRVGPGVLLLGHAAATQVGLVESALPLMKALADEFQVSVSLGQRDRQVMVIVQRAEAAGILRVNLHVGSSLPLLTSSLGRACLAAMNEEERRPLLSALKKATPAADWPDAEAEVAQAVADLARHGCVFNLGKSHREINAIGVPVPTPGVNSPGAGAGRQLALTCGGARSLLSRELLLRKVAPRLIELAASIAPLIDAAREPAASQRRPAR
jgi:DNA-binding IclR family transcriptional regulator